MKTYKESKYNFVISSDNDYVLLYNTVSGAVCNFRREIYMTFHGRKNILRDCILEDIIRLGFVVLSEFDETSELEKCKEQYIHNPEPCELSYVIAPTLSCNYDCGYCFEKNIHSSSIMNEHTINKTVEFIIKQSKHYKNIQKIFVMWFGGEPCLCTDVIMQISMQLISFATENNIQYNSFMVTNGSLLSQEIVTNLKQCCKINGIQISLDGLRGRYIKYRNCSEKYYDIVLNNIINLSQYINIHLRINIDRFNYQEIKILIDELLETNWNIDNLHIYFAPVKDYSGVNTYALNSIEYENKRSELINLIILHGAEQVLNLSLPNKVACGCGSMRHQTCVIGPDGKLYRCEHCLGNSKYIIGSVEDGFYNNEIDNMFLNMVTPAKCLDCNVLPICAQGCRADILIHKLPFDCEAFKLRIINDVARSVMYSKKTVLSSSVKDLIQELC